MESNGSLQLGFARLDITPPLGVRIGGYFYERIADGVLDPLYVNALAFGDGERSAVLLVCDTLGILGGLAHRLPKIVGDAAGLPAEAVFVCHTHTHTGPVIDGLREKGDDQYDAWFTRRLCDAARLALADRKEIASIRAAEFDTEGLTFTRRFRRRDGTYQTWASPGDPEIEGPASKADESLRLIRIARTDAPEIAIVNFQTHPDMTGGCKYSADFPGALRDAVEAAKENTRCIYLNGAEGQMIPENMLLPGKNKSSAYAGGYGRKLAAAALAHYDDVRPVSGALVGFGQTVVRAKTKRDPSRMEEAERIIALHEAGKDAELVPPHRSPLPVVAEAYALRFLEKNKLDYMDLTVSAVTLGPLAFVGIPGEPFCEIGVAIREQSPYGVTCVCCHTNGGEAYYPTSEAYEQGGYEPGNCKLAKGADLLLIGAAEKLLKDLRG